LLIDQIEFADVILLNKIDLVSEDEIKEIRAIIFKLNPLAKIIHTTHSNVDLKEIINTGLFNFDKAATNPGWLKEIKKETSESVEYGISSFVYRRRKPFHTQKLYDLVMSQDSKLIKHSGVIRSKGYMWLCTRHDSYGDWEHAGSLIDLNDGGNFFAALGDAYIDELFDEQGAREVRADFQGKYGDRRQELVFIGKDMSREAIEKMLDDCLLTEEEFAMGPGAWLTITDDKFNAWNEEGDDDDEWETDDEEEENVE
jgi:G3E family GTPase